MPPYRPGLETIPIAFVFSIYFCGDNVNALLPASFLNLSNSIGLKSGLCIDSHKPKNRMLSLLLNQLLITINGSSLLYLAISVKGAGPVYG